MTFRLNPPTVESPDCCVFPPASRRRRRAFTLIELLAAITIMGVLTALLFVGIGIARSSAQSSRCLSNLRQLGPAFLIFATDHGGRYPLAYNSTNNPDNNWWYQVAPYLGLKVNYDWGSVQRICAPNGPLGCPNTDPADTSYSLPWISYKMTRAHRDWLLANGGWSKSGPGLAVRSIANPASSLLIAEGHSHPEFSSWSADKTKSAVGLVYSHNGRTHALLADGHVNSYTPEMLQSDWTRLYTQAVEGP